MGQVRNNIIRIIDGRVGILLLVLALFFEHMPYFFATIPVLYAAAPYVRLALILVLGIFLILLKDNVRDLFQKELLLWGSLAWMALLYITSLLHSDDPGTVRRDLIPACVLALLICAVYSKGNVQRAILAIFLYYLIINTLQNASILIYAGQGIRPFYADPNPEYFFFGHINEGTTCAVNALLFGCIYSRQYRRTWDAVNWVNLLYSMAAAIVADCEVGEIIYLLTAIGLVLCYLCERWKGLRRILKWISLGPIMILNVIIEILVIPLGHTGWMERLGLDMRVHGRRELWDAVLASTRQQPLIGQGYSSWFVADPGGEPMFFWHQHSMYLMVAYETGLIGLLIFVFLFVIAIRELRKAEVFPVRLMTGIIIGSFMLALTIECCTRSEIFLLLGACYYFVRSLQKAGGESAPENGYLHASGHGFERLQQNK